MGDFKIESVLFLLTGQEGKWNFISIALKKLEQLQLTLDNSKSEGGKLIIRGKLKSYKREWDTAVKKVLIWKWIATDELRYTFF